MKKRADKILQLITPDNERLTSIVDSIPPPFEVSPLTKCDEENVLQYSSSTNSVLLTSDKKNNLPIASSMHQPFQDPSYTMSNDENYLHNDSDTNSIPDSQCNLSLLGGLTASECDGTDFSSDDSVKDPDFRVEEILPDSPDFSPQPGPSTSYLSNKKKFPSSINIELNNAATTQSSVDNSPLSVSNQSPYVDTQPSSVETDPPSVETSNVADCEPRRSRKRKAKPDLWKRNLSKALKNSGKSYQSMSKSKRVYEEKKLGPVCNEKCKLKCHSTFSDQERKLVFEEYYKMGSICLQRQFIANNLTKIETKYRYTRVGSNRVNPNHAYYLPLNQNRVRVCKFFFMNTLAISDKLIRTVIKKTNNNLLGMQLEDGRGKHDNHKKLDSNLIDGVKAHINSIPRIESHYCRAQTQREYIEGGYTIAALHRNYVDDCKSKELEYVPYQIYYNVFVNDFNISFWSPKKDQCEDCVAYDNAIDKTPLKEQYDLHLAEKNLARDEKNRDKLKVSENCVVAVYDLQAVMPCPRGDVSNFYYVSKLNLMNFTITELITKNTTCYVWHEGEGARGANEIGSCVLMYIDSLHEKATEDFEIIFYSDNCCGQQKNKFMLAMYQFALQKYPKIKSITHKFLIKGHTQNEGDSVHSVIQRNIKRFLKSSPIYVPDQYITLIRTAKKNGLPYNVRELSHDNFVNIKALAIGNYTTTDDKKKVKWADIKIIKVEREIENAFLFKTSYNDKEFMTVTTLKKKPSKSPAPRVTLKPVYSKKIDVSESKKMGILDLIRKKKVIPQYYESFYSNL